MNAYNQVPGVPFKTIKAKQDALNNRAKLFEDYIPMLSFEEFKFQ